MAAAPRVGRSNQLQSLQAGMPLFSHDDVVVHGNAQRLGALDDRLRHLDVRAARVGSPPGWLCTRMRASTLLAKFDGTIARTKLLHLLTAAFGTSRTQRHVRLESAYGA